MVGLLPPISMSDSPLPRKDDPPPTMESRREAQMLQKLRAQSLRTKERNMAEGRFLDRKLEIIGWRQRLTNHIIERELKELRDFLRKQTLLAQGTSEGNKGTDREWESAPSLPLVHPASLPEINRRARLKQCQDDITKRHVTDRHAQDSSNSPYLQNSRPSLTGRALSGGKFKWRRSAKKRAPPACKLGTTHPCNCFPCVKPRTYTHLGYEIDESKPPAERVSTATLMTEAAHETLLADLESNSVRRPLRSSMDQCVQKEKSLRKIISEMKTKSEAGRPKDWCVNYGEPTPRRKLFKVARPSAGSEDLAGL